MKTFRNVSNIAFFFTLLPFFLSAQSGILLPVFQIPFYVEDAIGNRDSVLLGFDPSVETDNIHPEFGEIELTSLFDSTLEMRAGYNSYTLSKIVTASADIDLQTDCYVVGTLLLFVKAKHQPLSFHWNHEYIRNFSFCQENAFMTPDAAPVLTDIYEWVNSSGRRGTCLTSHGDYTIELTWEAAVTSELRTYIPAGQNGEPESVMGMYVFLSMYPEISYCNRVDGAISPFWETETLLVFPNPVNNIINFSEDIESFSSVSITDALGQEVKFLDSGSLHNIQHIDISALPSGCYFIQARKKSNGIAVGKFVKTE